MSKNRNGMGSIRERADGRFEGRYTGSDGRQHSVFGKTSKECTQKLKIALSAVDSGTWTAPSKMTVAQWLEEWQHSYRSTIKETTKSTYRYACTAISEHIGRVALARLDQAHIMHLVADLSASKSPSSVRTYMRILNAALNDAVRVRLIAANPAKDAALPKQSKTVMHIIDKPIIPAFLDTIAALDARDLYVFMLLTGVRISEALGLQWGDVDTRSKTVTICRQLNGRGKVTTTKSGESRTMYVSDDVLALIDRQPRTSVFIFTQSCTRETLRRQLAKVGAQIGLPGLHAHDLRHSYAVAALRAGVDVKTVQHNLGHAQAAMTLDVYAAYTDDAGQQAVEKLKMFLGSF